LLAKPIRVKPARLHYRIETQERREKAGEKESEERVYDCVRERKSRVAGKRGRERDQEKERRKENDKARESETEK
jgi:hypothetical protein